MRAALFFLLSVLLLVSCYYAPCRYGSIEKFREEFVTMKAKWEDCRPESYSFKYKVAGYAPNIMLAKVSVVRDTRSCEIEELMGRGRAACDEEEWNSFLDAYSKYAFDSIDRINEFVMNRIEGMSDGLSLSVESASWDETYGFCKYFRVVNDKETFGDYDVISVTIFDFTVSTDD